MVNIRIVRSKIVSNTEIQITFTSDLDTGISTGNLTITSLIGTVPNLEILAITISGKIMTVTTRPMVSRAYYKIILFSTTSQPFRGARGETFIEDGATNCIYFVGIKEENEIRDSILNDISDVYNKESGSLVFDAIDSSAREILTNQHKIGEVGSANYVSIEITNEKITRGEGPYDRFGNEGVYQVLRVGSTEEGIAESSSISFTYFPSDPVSLQQVLVDEEEVSNSSTDTNSFTGLLITVTNKPVIKVTSVTLKRGTTTYTYNISQYGYGLLESKYDSDNAYSALDIGENQIRLSNAAVGPDFPFPQGNDIITVSYYYKKLGRDIGADSISITKIVEITRESVPAVATSFFLNNAPILNSFGNVATSNGIVWLDPAQNYNPTKKHPSFVLELQYDTSNLPKNVGEFMVNYSTGQVFVFGTNGSGTDGTTAVPPVATYNARYTYQDGLDYIFFSDIFEIASLPNGSLREEEGIISFSYEDTFAEGTDYNFASHVEVIGERVENRLIETIGIKTLYGPVNEVFRIYNETTGELYTTTRIKDNEIYFSGTNPPKTVDIIREAVSFEQILQANLVIIEEVSITGKTFVAFKIQLPDTKIGSATGNFIGTNFNTSLEFSNTNTFLREFYYDSSSVVAVNLSRLQRVGDYSVDYENGLIYLAVLSGASTDIGDVSYRTTNIQPRYDHILSVSNVYRSASVNEDNTETLNVGTVFDTTVEIFDISQAGETSVNDNPIVVSSDSTIQVSQDIFELNCIYQVADLETTPDPINFATDAVVSSSSPATVSLSLAGVEITDTNYGAGLPVYQTGSRQYVIAERISSLFSSGLAQIVSAVSVVDSYSGVNYFIQGSDGYVDVANNRIVLPSTASICSHTVEATYNVKLNAGAAVLVGYITGRMYIDYTYVCDEILISYEYGDNVLDWGISNALSVGDTYYTTYRYGALRNSLRDNFGILTGLDELSIIKDELDRETYRNALIGSLQSFPKGPTIPSLNNLVESFTQIVPDIVETAFLEWVLGRDSLHLAPMKLEADSDDELPTYASGKFGKGLLLDKDNQTASLPISSNLKLSEGTWEAFVIPNWDGIDNDAYLSFDIKFDGNYEPNKIFIGSNNYHPTEVPFTLSRFDAQVLGRPSSLHNETGYFIWYDSSSKHWRLRARAPIVESRIFAGNITTTGEFYNVKVASTASGYDGYDGYEIDEINDTLRSTNEKIYFSFVVDGYDLLNMAYDAYDSYNGSFAGFDGIDFTSDNLHYFLDAGYATNQNRISLYKDGQGFIRFKIYDNNKRVKQLSANISDWRRYENHHLAISYKINTIEMHDELHLFVDGEEIPNTYKYRGYLTVPQDTIFMDEASEILVSDAVVPTIGNYSLSTIAGSNVVTDSTTSFVTYGVQVGNRFLIRDDTQDGYNTQNPPYVYVKTVVGENQLSLKYGDGTDFIAQASLNNVKYSVNPLELETVSNPQIEKIRIFAVSSVTETELSSPLTLIPDYDITKDGYQDYINVYNGVFVGDSVILRSYGLMMARCKQLVYLWPDMKTNLLNTITPAPTSVSKIDVTKILVKTTNISTNAFALIATVVGGHLVPTLSSNLEFCQPSNSVTGRRLSATLFGSSNIDFTGINQVIFVGNTTDGYGFEILDFTTSGTQSTTRFFTSLTDIIASFTPFDPTKSVGSVEVRETNPLNWQDNSGEYAEVYLSVTDQTGTHGVVLAGSSKFTDDYNRFGEEDIGKIINITSPAIIANSYRILDVDLDPSSTVKDSHTVTLNTTWAASYSNIVWKCINTSYSDSGFANGLVTLKKADSYGEPFLLGNCWYEVDFPTYLVVPWGLPAEKLYIGSDMFGHNQASAVIDEMRILSEMSSDTGRGEPLPSSGRSITTDFLTVKEFTTTPQTLGLFHFNENITNSANFYTTFDKTFRQSENSVNTAFEQSGMFDVKRAYQIDNAAIFNNNSGTIEFWVSPILDTHNDPTIRYFVDLTPARQIETTALTSLTLRLPNRARSVTSVTLVGDVTEMNYFTGGSLATNGYDVTLGQALPATKRSVIVTFTPITSQGDRFSLYKDGSGRLVFLVTASGVDYRIRSPIYWKKNTWHRIFVGWDLNNSDNQDVLILMIDGMEVGTVSYGTGLSNELTEILWGSAAAGTTDAHNIVADINLLDTFNTINIGADFTGQFTALSRLDNMRFSSTLRPVTYLGGTGPGRLLGRDLLYTSNINAAQPVISDALTRLLLDFNTLESLVEYLATVRNAATGIFDFYVDVIDTFSLADTVLVQNLITSLIRRLKPAHTRAFVSFTK